MGHTICEVMHMDRKVAEMGENGRCRIFFKSFLPYNLFLEEEDAVNREILASRICRCFDVDQVLYEEGMFDGEKVSISDMNIMDYLTGNTSCEASQADGF